MDMQQAYAFLFHTSLVLLVLMLFACFIKVIKGPRVADRIVAVNMMSTIVTIIISVLALLLSEGYLMDVAIIYAMIGFLAVILLTKIYMGIYASKKNKEEKKND